MVHGAMASVYANPTCDDGCKQLLLRQMINTIYKQNDESLYIYTL